jgi:hypothetical protein
MSPELLVQKLKQARLRHTTEFELQGDVYTLLDQLGVSFDQEKRLSGRDVVDVLTIDGVAIECKIDGQPMAVHRQLERYAQHDAVKAIILLTARHMSVKPEINGKPAYAVKVGLGWL